MRVFVIAVLLMSSRPITGQQRSDASPYLPLDHWAYRYLDILQERGHLNSLFFSVRPYSRHEVVDAVSRIDAAQLRPAEKHWVELIAAELGKEFDHPDKLNVILRTRVTGLGESANGASEGDLAAYPEITAQTQHFAGSMRGRFDNALIDDPGYTGHRTDWLGGRVEDGYGLVRFGVVSFYLGRMANHWSPFRSESLILSANPYTYDQVGLVIQTKYIAFRSFHAQLSDLGTARRYLAIHRLDLKLPWNIQVGFTESVIYGGNHQQVDLAYLNPFSVYASVQLNDNKEANELLAFDAYIPYRNYSAKLQVLVDDFILDGASSPPPNRKTSSDRLGFIAGLQASDLLPGPSLTSLEYSRVGSYTYNIKSSRPYQSYTHHNRGLAAEKNDFDRWRLLHRYFPLQRFLFSLDLSYERTGERTLASHDFVDSTFIKLPFPSGTVQKKIACQFGVSYLHSKAWNSQVTTSFAQYDAFKHVSKKIKKELIFTLKTEYIIDSWLSLAAID